MKYVLIISLLITWICAESILEVEEPMQNEVNLEEGNHFQGDVVITEEQLKNMRGSNKRSKTVLTNSMYRWFKNSAGQVNIPYYFEPSSPYCKDLFKNSSSNNYRFLF